MLHLHLFTKQKPYLTTIKNIFIANADTNQSLPHAFRIYYLTANVWVWYFLHTHVSSEDFTPKNVLNLDIKAKECGIG